MGPKAVGRAPNARSDSPHGRWPMVGRVAECAAVIAGLQAGVGTVMVGEPGMGKSVLAAEIAARQGRNGWRTALVLGGGRAALAPPTLRDLLAGPGKRLLVVDDAHLLDEDSAAALWRLAREGRAVVLATARDGVRPPDEVARLWTSGVCDRVDLAPLGEADVRLLLEQVLGGDVDDQLARLLVARAAGNSLLIRELIRGARLVISPRTVQTHLLHVYDKLSITNRRALPGVLTIGPATGLGSANIGRPALAPH